MCDAQLLFTLFKHLLCARSLRNDSVVAGKSHGVVFFIGRIIELNWIFLGGFSSQPCWMTRVIPIRKNVLSYFTISYPFNPHSISIQLSHSFPLCHLKSLPIVTLFFEAPSSHDAGSIPQKVKPPVVSGFINLNSSPVRQLSYP